MAKIIAFVPKSKNEEIQTLSQCAGIKETSVIVELQDRLYGLASKYDDEDYAEDEAEDEDIYSFDEELECCDDECVEDTVCEYDTVEDAGEVVSQVYGNCEAKMNRLSVVDNQYSVLRRIMKMWNVTSDLSVEQILDYVDEGKFDVYYIQSGDVILDFRIFDPFRVVIGEDGVKDYKHPGCTPWLRGIGDSYSRMATAGFTKKCINAILSEDEWTSEDGLIKMYSDKENLDIIIETFRL